MLDEKEYNRWINQAKHTLKSAIRDAEAGDYAWACFKAQQAAEYALKALLWGTGRPSYGHALIRLAREAGLADKVLEESARLDKYYTAPRYADMWSEGSPHEYYTKSEASEAIKYAQKIITHVEKEWRKLKSYKGESKKETEE